MRLSFFNICLTVCLTLLSVGLRAQTTVFNLDFNNSTNSYLTQSGTLSGITLTNSGGVTFGTGQNGSSGALFNGTSTAYLSTTSSPALTAFTITFWMNTTTTNSHTTLDFWWEGAGLVDHELPGGTNDWGISQIGSKVAFGVGGLDVDKTIFSSSNVNNGQWQFVAATWNGTTGAMALYVNGTLESSFASGPTGVRNSASGFLIGSDLSRNPGVSFYNGSLDEIRIYDSSLNAAAISGLYASAVPEPTTYALVAGIIALGATMLQRRRQNRRAHA